MDNYTFFSNYTYKSDFNQHYSNNINSIKIIFEVKIYPNINHFI